MQTLAIIGFGISGTGAPRLDKVILAGQAPANTSSRSFSDEIAVLCSTAMAASESRHCWEEHDRPFAPLQGSSRWAR
jgi:hypothetical protein